MLAGLMDKECRLIKRHFCLVCLLRTVGAGRGVSSWGMGLPGVARRPPSFFASPKKEGKERRPQDVVPSGFPSQALPARGRKPTRCAQTCLRPLSDQTMPDLATSQRQLQDGSPLALPSLCAGFYFPAFHLLSSNALPITLTELNAIAAPANIGFSTPNAANGMPTTL